MSARIPSKKRFLYDINQSSLEVNEDQNMDDEVNPEFEALLDYLKQSKGCDLTSYRRSSLMRRFKHRMHKIDIETYRSYLQYLQNYSEEYLALVDDVLINVTNFFRDREAWDYLAAEIIPKLIATKQSNEPIRVWSAGCAAGQEIYSLLILLAEALGLEACLKRVQCFATDADESALKQARQGTYSHLEVVGMPDELLQKYFEPTGEGYVFHPELRRTVVFARHDLTQDAPISKIDLLTCRNVLIYFNPEAQASILVRFHFALKRAGFLFLGKAEALPGHRQLFTPIHSRHRIYTKETELELADRLAIMPKCRKPQTPEVVPLQNDFWEAAFETSTIAHLAVDMNGCLLHANGQARKLFGLTLNDLKRPLQELELGQLISSRTLIKALHSRQDLPLLQDVEWKAEEETKHFEIEFSRVLSSHNRLLGMTLTFTETSHNRQLAAEVEVARSELVKVSKALEDTKSELNTAYRELESTQQELEVLQQEMFFIYPDR